jgi:hypothetical protein
LPFAAIFSSENAANVARLNREGHVCGSRTVSVLAAFTHLQSYAYVAEVELAEDARGIARDMLRC